MSWRGIIEEFSGGEYGFHLSLRFLERGGDLQNERMIFRYRQRILHKRLRLKLLLSVWDGPDKGHKFDITSAAEREAETAHGNDDWRRRLGRAKFIPRRLKFLERRLWAWIIPLQTLIGIIKEHPLSAWNEMSKGFREVHIECV